MIKFTGWLTLLVLAMVTSGCATIIDGSSQPVTFNSSPNGARIYVNGMELGTTPLNIPVKRSKTTMILAKKNGYEDQQLVLQTKTNSWFWGNILGLGFYGSTTDYGSNAMIEYSPNMYHVTLNPIPLLLRIPTKSAADSERMRPPLEAERRTLSKVTQSWPTSGFFASRFRIDSPFKVI